MRQQNENMNKLRKKTMRDFVIDGADVKRERASKKALN